MKDKITLLLDLDGTLKTDYDHFVRLSQEAHVIQHDNQLYSFLKRPHIEEFLLFAKENFNVYLATFGKRDYALQVLNIMGVNHYFDKLITNENFSSGSIGNLSSFILVDNSIEMGRGKIAIIDEIRDSISILKEFIVVKTYKGDREDNILLDLIERLREIQK